MADELTVEKLEVMYPKMGPYIRAARKRGYSPTEIDEALTSGLTERRKAGRSIRQINEEYGIDTPEAKGWVESATSGFTGAPNLSEGTALAPAHGSEHLLGPLLDTGADLGERAIGPFREGYKTLAGRAVGTPYALNQMTGENADPVAAVAEALLAGVFPGVGQTGFPGTEAANEHYLNRYPGARGTLVEGIGPSKFELGFPVSPSAAPAVGRAGSAVASRTGKLGPFLAALGEMITTGPDFDAAGSVRKMDWSAVDQGLPMGGQMYPGTMRQMDAPGLASVERPPRPDPARVVDDEGFQVDPGAPVQSAPEFGRAVPGVIPQHPKTFGNVSGSVDGQEIIPLGRRPDMLRSGDFVGSGPTAGVVKMDPSMSNYLENEAQVRRPGPIKGIGPQLRQTRRANRSFDAASARYPNEVSPEFRVLQEDARTGQMRRDLRPGEIRVPRRDDIPLEQSLDPNPGITRALDQQGPDTGRRAGRAAEGAADHYQNWLKKNKLKDSGAAREEFFKSGRGAKLGGGPARGVGAEGEYAGADIYTDAMDRAFDSKGRDLPYGSSSALPGHTNRPTDIPRSQALARVPGNQVVDSTRWGHDGDEVQRLGADAYRVDPGGPIDEDGRIVGWDARGPGAQGRPRIEQTGRDAGVLNPAAFPDRLPMGDRQGETVRPRNRFGEELDTGKMAVRQEAAMQNPGLILRERNYRLESGNVGRASTKNAEYTQAVSGPQTGRYADPNRLRKETPALSDLVNRDDKLLDRFTAEFSSGPGGQFARDLDNIAAKALAAIKKAAATDPRAPYLKQAIASFQKNTRIEVQKADNVARGLLAEIKRRKKAGASAEELKEFQELQYNLLKSELEAQTAAFRRVYVKTAKAMFPEASIENLLAEAGEVEALQNGLALSPWSRAAKAVGVGAARSVSIIKTIKVLGSTTAYANNVGSNMISTFLGGGSVADVKSFAESVSEFRAGSDLYKEAMDDGLFGTEFFAKQLEDVFREIELAAKDGKSVADIIEQTWRKGTGNAAKYYDGIDKVFKFHMYRQARTGGVKLGTRSKMFAKTPTGKFVKLQGDELAKLGDTSARARYGDKIQLSRADAVEHVNRYFPNYENLPQFIQRMRKNPAFALVANPFLAFPVEFARIYKNAAQDHPLRFFGAAGALAGAVAATAQATGEKPDYHKFPNKIGLAIPFTDDGTGAPRVVDLTYMIPLGDTLSGEAWRKDKSTIDNVQQMMKNAARNTLGRGFLSPQDDKFRQPGAPDFGDSLYRLVTERSGASAREFVQHGVPNLVVPPVAMKASQLGQKRAYGEDPGLARELREFASVRLMPDSKIEKQRDRGEFRGRLGDLEDDLRRVQNQKQLDPATRKDRERRIREQINALKRAK